MPLDKRQFQRRAPRAELRHILFQCSSGILAPNIGLMRLLMEAADPDEAREALDDALAFARRSAERHRMDRLQAVADLWRDSPCAWAAVRSVIRQIDHTAQEADADETIARLAAAFDRAVQVSPEGSVALYSLGSADLLKAATDEIAEQIRAWELTGPDRTCLDLGCGIGRMESALAPDFAEILGLDISAEMIRTARERCAGLGNVRFEQTSGRDLGDHVDARFDLVLAVDSFPYLMQAGSELARAMVKEAARVLRPGGTFLILNFSYRGDPEADQRDAQSFAHDAGLQLRTVEPPRFRYWDGLAFLLDKPPA